MTALTLSNADLSHVLVVLLTLLCAAQLGGFVFRALGQPPVIGEICAGMLLGPTVLGRLLPGLEASLFTDNPASQHVVGAFYQFGMLLLVYLTGSQLGRAGRMTKARTIGAVATVGLLLPFAAGLGLAALTGTGSLSGTAGTADTLALVMGMAVAVTSIPVISRIMMDLGIIETTFAQVVLAVAVLEDVALYVMLTVILGIAGVHSGSTFGLPRLFTVHGPGLAVGYYLLLPGLFLVAFLTRGRALFERLIGSRFNVLELRSPVAFRLIWLLGLSAICVGLGIDPLFGALVAGLCVASRPSPGEAAAADATTGAGIRSRSQDTIAEVANAFFIPIYFAVVGLRLDLAHNLDPWFLLWFVPVACIVKSVSVWLGAKLAGEPARFAIPLAVAMNARGGPGIVLASAVYAAGIINARFFTALVLLSMITSYLAGAWLTVLLNRPDRDWLTGGVATGQAPTGQAPTEGAPTEGAPTEGAPTAKLTSQGG